MRKNELRLWRAMTRVVVLLVVLSAVPAALGWLVGNPLPESMPSLTAIELGVRQRNIPGEVVVKSLSVLLWLLWAQLVWSTLWELLLAGPRRVRGTRTGGAPLVNRWINRIVGRAISGLFAAGVVVGSANLASSTVAGTDVSSTATTSITVATPIMAARSMAPMAVVGGGGSDLAISTDQIPRLESESASGFGSGVESEPLLEIATKTVSVQPGDSLWSLANGDVAMSRQILKMNSSLDSALDVVPGLTLVVPTTALPTVQSERALVEPALSPAEPAGPQWWENNRIECGGGEASGSTGADQEPVSQPTPTPTATRTPTATSTPTVTATATATATALTRSPAAYLSGAGSLLLCSGALGLLGRRRRYVLAHRRPGTRPIEPPAPLQQIERLVRDGDHPELAAWLTSALHSLAARPYWPDEQAAVPVAASLQAEQLVVTMSEADSIGAPLPWATKDGGKTWRLPRSWAVTDLPIPLNKNPFPAFVTIGDQLLINLEAIGFLSVVGNPSQASDLIRSMIVELATSPIGELPGLLASPALAHLCPAGTVVIEQGAALVEQATHQARLTTQQLVEGQAEGVHQYRLVDGRVVDPVIVFCSSADLVELDALVEQARNPNTALVVVVLGRPAHAEWSLRCEAGSVELEPMGITAKAAALSPSMAAGLDALLHDANSQPNEVSQNPVPETITEETTKRTPITMAPPEVDLRLQAATGREVVAEGQAQPLLEIRLLGPIEVAGIEGSLTPQQLALVSYLACVESATRSEISEALWDGRAMSPGRFPNLLAEVRNRIGRDHLPDAVGGRYRLAHVQVDLHDFERLCSLADADLERGERSDLIEALELVRGIPLTVSGKRYWSWVGDNAHLTARLESQIADTALSLAEAAQKAGDWNTAQWAVQQGLLAAPLDESLILVLAGLYVELGKSMAAKRLVENWEASIARLGCGPPSNTPRRSLSDL